MWPESTQPEATTEHASYMGKNDAENAAALPALPTAAYIVKPHKRKRKNLLHAPPCWL